MVFLTCAVPLKGPGTAFLENPLRRLLRSLIIGPRVDLTRGWEYSLEKM